MTTTAVAAADISAVADTIIETIYQHPNARSFHGNDALIALSVAATSIIRQAPAEERRLLLEVWEKTPFWARSAIGEVNL